MDRRTRWLNATSPPGRGWRHLCARWAAWLSLAVFVCYCCRPAAGIDEVLPKHITPPALKAVRAGLEYLAKSQHGDGSWTNDQGGRAYPVAITGLAGTALLANGNTPTRGRYAPQVEKAVEYLLRCSTDSGLITGPTQDNGQPMHGHGFAMMFLFGLALSAPLIVFALMPSFSVWLTHAGQWLKLRAWLTGLIFILLGVWSIWFGLYVDPQNWSGR